MEIYTSVEFSAAHRLSFHKGQCKNLHGHTWKVDVAIGGEDGQDMIVDFGDIKSLIKDQFDHTVLVYEQDDILYQAMAKAGFKMSLLPCETTAENLAKQIREMIAAKFGIEKRAVMISVYETTNNVARI